MLKNKLAISILICGCFFLNAGRDQESGFQIRDLERSMVPLNEKLYVCKYEASNIEYRHFLHALKQAQKLDDYTIAIYDSLNWEDVLSYSKPYRAYYHSHLSFDLYPTVNISYEGAMLFCEWLTDSYNSNPKRKFEKVKFKLPTVDEWKLAARGDNDEQIFPWPGIYMRDSHGDYKANFARVLQSHIARDQDTGLPIVKEITSDFALKYLNIHTRGSITAPVQSFEQTESGIHNISGNVSEMLAEKGRTKGGSWHNYGYYLRIDAEDEYGGAFEPSAMVGFRYFMEVVEDKK